MNVPPPADAITQPVRHNCLMKTITRYFTSVFCMWAMFTCLSTMVSCSDDVDDSNLYVFDGSTVTDLVKEAPDLGYYYSLLKKARSGKKGSTMDHLLETRGNYTVFAPTNDAVQHFVDSIYETTGYNVDEVPDSLAQQIVFNSIIDTDMQEGYSTVGFREGAFDYKTMADRFATVSFAAGDTTGRARIFINAFSEIIRPDNEAGNGWLHVVNRVVMPYASSLPDLIAGQDNLQIFGHLLFVTSWRDSLNEYRDEEYEEQVKPEYGYSPSWTGIYPQHRYLGYTAFVETDSLLCSRWGITIKRENGNIVNWSEIMERVNEACRTYYPLATSNDLTSPDNAVNQFVGYHLIRGALSYNKLVIHYNETGYSLSNPDRFGINKMQYYESLGKNNRIVKITEGEHTEGKRINRYVSEYDWDTYEEIDVPRKGILVYPDNGSRDIQALNGFYYIIDDVLVYDNDVPGKVLNERMRWDALSFQPELFTNGLRALPNQNFYFIPCGYLSGISFNEETCLVIHQVYAAVGCRAYEQDEPIFEGPYDVTYRLPLVPNDGTYELRIAVGNGSTCGMMQVYFGTDKNNLTAIGLPLDMRYEENTPWIQYFLDTDDRYENSRLERNMRNHDVMKGSNCYGDFSYSATVGGRNSGFGLHKLRHIIYRGSVVGNTRYYLRFKNVLDNPTAHLDIDYIEWVPKSVYDGVTPEDYY